MKTYNKARCMLSRPQLDIIIAAIKFTLNSEDGREYMEKCVPSSCNDSGTSVEEKFEPAVKLRNTLKTLRKQYTTEKVVYAGKFCFKSFEADYVINSYIECESLDGTPVGIDEDNLKKSLQYAFTSEGLHITPTFICAECWNAVTIDDLKNEGYELLTRVMQKEGAITSNNDSHTSHRCLVNVFRKNNLKPKIFNEG